MSSILHSIARYMEEGQPLYPDLVLSADVRALVRTIPDAEYIRIGAIGQRDENALKTALKNTAALALDGWVICVQWARGGIEYGILRTGTSELAIELREIIFAPGATTEIPTIYIHPLGGDRVECTASSGRIVQVDFSASSVRTLEPTRHLDSLIGWLIREVEPAIAPSVASYWKRILSRVGQHSHGLLVAVPPSSYAEALAQHFRDAIWLAEPLHVVDVVRAHLAHSSAASAARLRALGAVLHGMFTSDGITVVSTESSVLGYRLFVQPVTGDERAACAAVRGGARHRAFTLLSTRLSVELVGCYIRSHDGSTDSQGRPDA